MKEEKKPTVADFDKFKKPLEKEDIITFYTYRKISGALALFFNKIGFKAEYVAALSPVLDLIAIYFILESNPWAAVLFIQLAILIDCVDGQLARYHISVGKKKAGTNYGEYFDSVIGVVGFAFVAFFAGYVFSLEAGVLAMFTLLMLNLTASKAAIFSDSKAKTYEGAKNKIFPNLRGRIGLTHDIQRFLFCFSLILNTPIFIYIFIVLGTFWWVVKFWLYRKL